MTTFSELSLHVILYNNNSMTNLSELSHVILYYNNSMTKYNYMLSCITITV